MEITTNDKNTAIEMLARASQVLEVTYYEWRLHELPPPGAKRSKKRQRGAAVHNRQGGGFYAPGRSNAFA